MSARRRRLLLLLPFAPRRDASHGGARLIAEEVEALATRHDLALLCLRAADEPSIDEGLARRCQVVEEVVRSVTLPSLGHWVARWARQGGAVLRGEPLWVADWRERAYTERLRLLTERWRPEVVQIEYHVMGQYLPALEGCDLRSLLIEYEPGYAAACERWRNDHGPLRWARALDARAWKRFERRLLARVDGVVALTPRDVDALRVLSASPASCIRPSMALPERPLSPSGTAPFDVAFIGNFVHPPNRDAAWRLATAIHPHVRRTFPAACLLIVGDHPSRALQALAGTNIVVTGRVPDVTPWLDRAAIVVAPLRHGSGIRVKVLEALAAGKALVASPLALEGIDVVSGEHCLVAETDEEIIAAITMLLADPARRCRLATAARAWALANLGWSRSLDAYAALYDRLLEPEPASAAPDDTVVDLTVAVATLDRPTALARCLEGLLAGQLHPAEIIVVDQGANDEARHVCARLEPPAGVTLRYHRQERRGLAASRNEAIALATRSIIAVTDDDCVPDARWVATLARTFAAASTCGAVTGRVLPLGAPAVGVHAVSSRTASERVDHCDRALPWAVGTGANFAVRRDVLGPVRYDERLGVGTPGAAGEDTDLLYRLLRGGIRIRYEPAAVVYHERQSRQRRLASRSGYGRGIGACCALWARGGDGFALLWLGRWLASRLRRMAGATLRREGTAIHEELLVLVGTLAGLLYGATLDRAPTVRSTRVPAAVSVAGDPPPGDPHGC